MTACLQQPLSRRSLFFAAQASAYFDPGPRTPIRYHIAELHFARCPCQPAIPDPEPPRSLHTQALEDANFQKSDVDEVILVGGSTRIPKVQALLQEFFDGKVRGSLAGGRQIPKPCAR